MDAAADLGDIAGAAGVIDFMAKNEIDIDVFVFNSAINACKNTRPPSHSAAMFLLNALLERGLQPSVVTFTNLVGAHQRAKLSKLESLLHQMDLYGIQPDNVFAETYLSTLTYGLLQNVYTFEAAKAKLADVPEERLKAAKAAMHRFVDEGVELTKLCKFMKAYFDQM